MRIAIFGQYYQNDTRPIIRDIFLFLNENQVDLVIEADFLTILYEHELLKKSYKTFSSYEDLKSGFDLMISIGGDGTILRAATFVRDLGIPILGINAGRLGFLAKVQKENINAFLQLVLERRYTISERTLLELQITPDEGIIPTLNFAMNEVTVSRKDTTSMITIETHLDHEYLTSYWADGLIVATPTGTTGYSLSCGGPVLTPDAKCWVITPIAPHNLNARPLVIPDHTTIRLRVSGREDQFLVSLDSRLITLTKEHVLTIRKNDFTIKMVEIQEESFLKTLRNKLLWGEDKRN
ncbi:NAD kinase [Flavobacterium sp.]|jgi:NAD+ kinase|uniref:NAD kinase n=1 Tax=Flavobacterium sp. TaxID=239 RepID=UPI0022BBDAA3|nr:NAD kinase [Flavobacterium sp.]MCZ8144189.1 NAD kinase [Flavobacterium sp.]